MFSPLCMHSMALIKMLVKPILEHFVQISVTGIEHIPRRGPFVLVSNHRSDLDPLVIGSVVPRYVAWIADSFLFNIPIIGMVLRRLGTIPISVCRHEQLKAFRSSRQVLRAGQPVGIFPEGHESIVRGSRRRLGKFHYGFAELASVNKAPIIPVTVIPVEEEIRPLSIPDFVKDWLELPPDVASTHQRLVYRQVHVEIGQRIDTRPHASGVFGAVHKGHLANLVSQTRIAIGNSLRRGIA